MVAMADMATMGSVRLSLDMAMDTMESGLLSLDTATTMESVMLSPAMDIMVTMGRGLLSLATATTMESVRLSLDMAMDTMESGLLSLAMVTMESVKLSPVLAIMAMEFHTTVAMCF